MEKMLRLVVSPLTTRAGGQPVGMAYVTRQGIPPGSPRSLLQPPPNETSATGGEAALSTQSFDTSTQRAEIAL